MAPRALITGAESFVGSHLAEELAARGYDLELFVLDGVDPANLPQQLHSHVRFGNLATGAGLDAAMENVDVVFHLAAATAGWRASHFVAPNLRLTAELAAAIGRARRRGGAISRVVFLSSQAAVGTTGLVPGAAITEEHTMAPRMFYGIGKAKAERMLQSTLDVPLTTIRAPTVYGPRDRKLLWLFSLVSRGIRPLLGRRAQQFSLVHVRDLVRALADAAAPHANPGLYYVASQERVTWGQISRAIARAVGRPGLPVPIPYLLIFTVVAAADAAARLGGRASSINVNKIRALGAPSLVVSADRARRELGFRPDCSLHEGMAETVQWYRRVGWLPA